ncbi:MAG: hypothetical protein QXG76_02430 [Candidatus Bathyarchaeia archaeon]
MKNIKPCKQTAKDCHFQPNTKNLEGLPILTVENQHKIDLPAKLNITLFRKITVRG